MKAKEAVFSRGDAETQREVLDRINRNRQESTGIELSAGPPQSRLGPDPEPLPSCASLRTGKLDSCRFLSTPVDSAPLARGPSRTRPLTPALVAPSRRRAESTGIELRAKPTDHFSTRLRRPGGLGGPGCLVLALKAQRGVPERSSNQPKPGTPTSPLAHVPSRPRPLTHPAKNI